MFNELKGLVFVTGENQVEPTLGANGVGKSSVFEAVFWTLYGKTSRGLKAGALRSWGTKEQTMGYIHLTHNGQDLSIRRTWGPNSLQIVAENENHDVSQEDLEKLLGVSPRAFLYSRFFAQFVPSFLDLGAAQQLDLFTEVLALAKWEEAADRAGTYARATEQGVAKIELNVARTRGVLSEKQAHLDKLEEVLSCEARLLYASALIAKNRVREASNIESECEATMLREKKSVDVDNTEVDSVIAELAEELNQTQVQRNTLQTQYERDKRALDKYVKDGVGSDSCPTCGQHIDKSKARKAHAQVEEQMRKTITAQLKEVADLDQVLTGLRNNLKDAKALRVDVDTRAYDAATRACEQAKKGTQRAQLEFEMVLSYVSHAEPLLPAAREEVAKHVAEVRETTKSLNDLRKLLESYKFWQREFKEVRLFLIEESLSHLEVEANSALHELGLVGWSISFDIESENKSGTIKRGFSVMVSSPDNTEPVPWEAWSGGESQRLRLAVTMGLSNLINQRLGMDSNIEFWDEPSTWLSTSGIADLMQTLKSRSETTGRTVVVADHRNPEFGGFDSIVRVVKTEAGSIISTN